MKNFEIAMRNFNEKWINLLTGGQIEKEIEFCTVCEDSPSVPLAIMKYRRLQMQKGRGQDITIEDLIEANNDDVRLTEVLQELFLEPVTVDDIGYIREKNIDLEKLYNRHREDNGTRFMSIALTI